MLNYFPMVSSIPIIMIHFVLVLSVVVVRFGVPRGPRHQRGRHRRTIEGEHKCVGRGASNVPRESEQAGAC